MFNCRKLILRSIKYFSQLIYEGGLCLIAVKGFYAYFVNSRHPKLPGIRYYASPECYYTSHKIFPKDSFGRRLAKGIDHAITINADIIAIPMGGIGPMNQLRDAIRRANAAGIIVIVAASNFTGPLRIVPAFWDETITVGAINDRLKPWVGSAFGRWVDLSAPGVNINHARTEKRDNEIVYEVKLAQGTSDATALVAGAAALWISYHGKDKLIERFGLDQIPTIFRKLLKEHGVSTPKGFPSKRYGSGVLDVVKLLEAPLPTNTKSQKKM